MNKPELVTAPSSSITDDAFGAFGAPTAPPPTAGGGAPSMASGGSVDDFADAFGFAVGTSASQPPITTAQPPAAPPGAMLDFDFLGGPPAPAASKPGSADLLNSTMAQFGMMDTLTPQQPLTATASSATSAAEAWLAQLPDLSFVTSPELRLPAA